MKKIIAFFLFFLLTAGMMVPVQAATGLSVRGTTIKIGQTAESVRKALGKPDRQEGGYYGDETYVYNSDPEQFLMVYFSKKKVCGYYTDSEDFKLGTTAFGSKKIGKKKSPDGGVVTWYQDKIGKKLVTGVQVVSPKVTGSVKKKNLAAMEKQIFDITNSARKRNGKSVLKWSKKASTAAGNHSLDMAVNHYFSHINKKKQSPYDRLLKAGVKGYPYFGENIIAGYGNPSDVVQAWMESSSHRKNILGTEFQYLGVGATKGGEYGIYYTQNFFGK